MPTGVYAPNLSVGNGVATVFPYNFRILAATHLKAVVNGVTLTLGVDYSVDGVGNVSGGNVTFTTAPANGVSVLRYRDVPYVRTEDYQYNGDLREDVVDADFDNREMQIQQLAETLVRALTVPIGTSGFSGVLPTPVGAGGRILSVKAAENGIEFISLAGSGSIVIPVPIAQGGTNATTAATALTALGALSQDADDITTVTPVSDDVLLFGDASDGNLVRKATIAAVVAGAIEAEGADVASGATTDIWASDGNTRHITGATGPITSFGTAPQAGKWMRLIFDSTPTLTQGANLNLNAGGADIVMAAGDVAFVYADTTTQLDVFVIRKSGAAVVGVSGLRTMDGYGCVVSNNVTDATNDLDFAVGRWRADDDTGDLELTAAITKRADATFVVGTNQGMLDEGTLTNSSFHGYLIKRLDTAVVDVLLSRNPGRTMTFTVTIASPGVATAVDHGLTEGSSFVPTTTGALPTGMTASTRYYVLSTSLTADTFRFAATQGGAAINTSGSQSGVHTLVSDPVMPASYTKKRRIFSILRESATLIGITQTDDKFYRNTMVNAWNVVSPGATAVTRDAKTPRGIRSAVVLYGRYEASLSQYALVTDLRNTDSAPTLDHNQWAGSGASVINTAQTDIFTDFSGQVRTRTASPITEWSVQCRGWIDNRGRL